MAADHVLQRGRGALVGHVHDIDLGLGLEQFAGQMRGRAIAGRGEIELAGLRLGERDQLLQRFRRHVRIDHQDIGLRADQRDRHEILLRAVGELFVQALVGGEDAVVAHQQRVAVGRRMGDRIGRDIAAGAGPVLDDERHAEQLLHLLADDAGEHVARAAGRERHHQRDRPARIVGRARRRGPSQGQTGRQHGEARETRHTSRVAGEDFHGEPPA